MTCLQYPEIRGLDFFMLKKQDVPGNDVPVNFMQSFLLFFVVQ